jgi:hypothetical protein
MNEYDNILNRIVEEFYDTGKLILEARGKRLTNDELRNIALNYKTRGEWVKKDKNSYQQAIKRGKEIPGFYEDITSHMEIINASKKYIYAYEFYDKENNPIAVYVGLTCDMTRRNKSHQTGYCPFGKEETQVFKFIKKNPKLKYKIKKDPNQYIGREAEQKEKEWEEKYRHNGWRTLNIAKPGSLGGLYKLTNDQLRNIALNYETKSEWEKNDPTTYDQARYRDKNFPGFWEDITSHMIVLRKYLTNDELRDIAKKYRTKIEWKTNDPNTYNMGLKRGKEIPGFWEDITSHMGSDDILDRIVEEFYDTGKFVF